MGVLVDYQIRKLCEGGLVIPYNPSLVNPASLDICIGNTAQIRMGRLGWFRYWWMKVIRKYKVHLLKCKQNKKWIQIELNQFTAYSPFLLNPGDRVLVSSLETINIPTHIVGEFFLKSSRGREFYEQMKACWCDPGWSGSKLTMEIINFDLQSLPIYPGFRIGQMVFEELAGIPDRDYSKTGRYNNDTTVQGSKG